MKFESFDMHALLRWLDPSNALGAALLALIILIVAFIISGLLTRIMRRSAWVIGHLGRRVDPTAARYLIRLKTLLVFLAAAMLFSSLVPALRALLGTMLAGAGITALIIGFAAKSTLANLMSGMSLIIYRPVRIGDIVDLEGKYGYIEDITLRHTIMRTWRNERIIIPNEKMDSMTLINFSLIDPKVISTLEIGVSYDTDIDLARRLILDEARQCPHRLKDAETPWLKVVGMAESSITLRLYFWTATKDEAFSANFWLLERIKKRLDAEGVEIPFPYRTLVFKKDMPDPRHETEMAREAEFSEQAPPPMVVEQPAQEPENGLKKGLKGLRRLRSLFRRQD